MHKVPTKNEGTRINKEKKEEEEKREQEKWKKKVIGEGIDKN